MQEFGKTLIVIGGLLVIIGGFLMFFTKIPFLGKLPGDIYIERKNFSLYAPFATSILLSIVVSLLMWLWAKR